MNMRASGASELRKFSHFHILKLSFPSIFCRYLIYFVSESYIVKAVADLRGGGGGLGGLTPPPLGLPSKNLMCIEKRHHNISRPTQYALCLRLSLRQ